jgi:cytochrome c oxidase subunit 3
MKKFSKEQLRHPFHLVDPSPWPIIASFGTLFTTVGAVMTMHSYQNGSTLFFLGIFMILFVMAVWWRDVVREATFEGRHTSAVQKGLRIGMVLFIVSEAMFFFAFFWAFFHSSLNPTPEIGGVWPPVGIECLDPWGVPFLNTIVLLTSGATVTWAHHAIVAGSRKESLISLFITILFAIFFTILQGFEYIEAPFTISDGVYGSVFFLITGFHGFHVFIGTCFLAVCLGRHYCYHFTRQHHFGFEAASWYWHFVDVIWLLVFVVIYWWGGN